MNKTAVFSFTLLIILVSQISLLFASYTVTKTIAASGIIKEEVAEPTTIRKHLIAYGGVPEAEVPHMAKFDVLDIDFQSTHLAESIKALNPNIKIICYNNMLFADSNWDDWLEVNAHEDWFIHSLDGRRIVLPSFPREHCMNITNPGWRQHYVDYSLNKFAVYPALDGIFADNVYDMWAKEGWSDENGNPIPPEQVPDLPTFHDDMREFLSYVKSRLGNKLLIPNVPVHATDYIDASDGMFMERHLKAPWWDINYYGDPGFALNQINALAAISGRGKYYMAWNGIPLSTNPTLEELERAHRIMLYCLCGYLLGVSGPNASFGWLNIYARDGSKGYYPEMDIDVGNPRGSYYQVNPDVYGRDFDHAKVFVNFSSDKTYEVTANGLVYTLPPHSGVIAL